MKFHEAGEMLNGQQMNLHFNARNFASLPLTLIPFRDSPKPRMNKLLQFNKITLSHCMNLVLPPGGKYMQQSAEEFLVSIMNWLYNRNINLSPALSCSMWVPFRMEKKWLQWSSTRSLVLWWFRSSCCIVCMLRGEAHLHSCWWIFSQQQKVPEKAHIWTSNKKVNQPGAYLPTLLTSLLTYIMKTKPYIQTQSCKVQVRRNQTTSHVAWLTSNQTCWWWRSSSWWWSCQVNEVAT